MDNSKIIEEQLLNHKSIRNFDDRPVDNELIKHLVDVARHASTTEYIQAYSVINVTDPEKRAFISENITPQKHVKKAPAFLVFLADVNRIMKLTELRGEKVGEDFLNYTEIFLAASMDAAILAQNFTTIAEAYGLGICYIGSARNNLGAFTELLNCPKGVYPLFGMTVGYPTTTFSEMLRPRLPLDSVYFENEYAETEKETFDEYDKIVKEYYIARSRGKSEMDYSERAIEFTQKAHRPELKEVLKKQGYGLE